VNRCQACDAPLRWAATTAGRRMPLNANPDPAGNVTLDDDGIARVWSGADLVRCREAGRLLYMPHHATCPQSATFKRR